MLKNFNIKPFLLVSMSNITAQQLVSVCMLIIYLLVYLYLDTLAINASGFSKATVNASVYINGISIQINSNRTEMKNIAVDKILEWNNGEVAEVWYNSNVKIQIICRTGIEKWSALL